MSSESDCPRTDSGAFVVFGATGGIGSATARQLTERGARVVLAARHPRSAAELDIQGETLAVRCDLTDSEQLSQAVRQALDFGGGRIDGMALCVGSLLLKPAHLTSDEEWQSCLSLNLTAAFQVARAAGAVMRKGGSVVFCSSAAAAVGLANHDAIAAVKAGIEGLTRSAAATYAARRLRFNAVAPGLVRTPMSHAITTNPASLEASISMHALGRIGEPEDIASAITWLLDPRNDWVSGQILRVDGGMSGLRPIARR